jgi:hypothetical protein
MLAGGLLGASVGYGLGYMGEQVMPETWQKGKLRKTLGILGGLAGAAPGVAQRGVNLLTGRSATDDVLSRSYPNDPMLYVPKLADRTPNKMYRPDMPYVPKPTDLVTTSNFSAAAGGLRNTSEMIKEVVSQTDRDLNFRGWALDGMYRGRS